MSLPAAGPDRLATFPRWRPWTLALLVCAISSSTGVAAPPAAKPLQEIVVLATEHNDLALERLRHDKDTLAATADYPSQIQLLKLYRLTLSNAGRLKEAYATDTDIVALATRHQDETNIAIGRTGANV